MKIVLQYLPSPGFRAQIETLFGPGGVLIVDETDRETFAREMADAEVLLHVLERVTAEVIAGAPRLRLIQKLGVGVNTIDLEAARAGGVAVANMPGVNSIAVAEMALALMFAVLRRIAHLDAVARDGWRPDPAVMDATGEIAGRTVGLLGMGASARRLAPVLQALRAKVVYCARTPKPDLVWPRLSFEALLDRVA
jgi:phosphoglycerate dehydrogenase-like enzyme